MSLLILLLLCAGMTAAQTESVLHSFAATTGDGSAPWAGLARDASGALYGTTQYGGASNAGTIFQLTPPAQAGGAWTETVLYSFNGAGEGAYPQGKLVLDRYGVIYGTTQQGGNKVCIGIPFDGCGTVFRLKPPISQGDAWSFRTIYKFLGGLTDGYYPAGGLVFDTAGALYGTTYEGGSTNGGMVYKLSPPTSAGATWSENVLYQFQGPSSGSSPLGNLAIDSAGSIFGAAQIGGVSYYGTIFKLSPSKTAGNPWSFTVLYTFSGPPSGGYPNGDLILGKGGIIFGTTVIGGLSYQKQECGTVFKPSPPVSPGAAYTERSLYKFQCGLDGANPTSGPASDGSGNLYVAASQYGESGFGCSGAYSGCGAVVKLAPPSIAGGLWTTSVLYTFTGGVDGGVPYGQPTVDSKGNLYDVTWVGGEEGSGTVFEITP